MSAKDPAPAQLTGLVTLALFTLGTETLPRRLSALGGAAWLCPLLAGAAVWGAVLLLTRRPLAGRRLLSGERRPLGARALALLLLLWGLTAGAGQTLRVSARLAGDLRGSPLLLAAAVLALSAWMAAGGLAALGRAGRLFGWAVGLTFALTILFGLADLRWDWVLLWDGKDLSGLPRGTAAVLGTLAPGAYALLLVEDLKPGEKGEGRALRGPLALFPLLALGDLLAAGRLGPGLAAAVESPFFQMVSGLGFQGAFQRLEELVSALWLLGDLILLAVLLLALRRLAARAFRVREGPGTVWALAGCLLALTAAWIAWGSGIQAEALWPGELAAGLILAGLTAVTKNFKKIKKGG